MSAQGRKAKRRRRTTKKKSRPRKRRVATRRAPPIPEGGETGDLLAERITHPETSPTLTGGDLDADWQRASSSGEEAIGGSVATPDQDVVDEIGRALGVEQAADAEVTSSEERLRKRDRKYWDLERRAAEREAEQ
jgi:hypothetical protein